MYLDIKFSVIVILFHIDTNHNVSASYSSISVHSQKYVATSLMESHPFTSGYLLLAVQAIATGDCHFLTNKCVAITCMEMTEYRIVIASYMDTPFLIS